MRNAVTLVIDGREVTAPEATMLHDAAQQGDIEIPVFCYEPKLGEPVGACRMCLVEIEGMPKLQTACSTAVRDGMVVYTQTDQVKEAQNAVVEFLLVNHPLDCPVCDKGGECPLQDISMGWGPGRSRFTDPKRHFEKPLELSPLVAIDRERCILCYRCVRFSQEVAEDEQLQLLERGDRSFVGTFDERPYIAPFHGNIIELCPVGALTSYTYRFRARPWDIEQAGSICTLCPSQCNVGYTVRDERVIRVLARDNAEVDDGWLCDKGRFGYQMFGSAERITRPMARGGDGKLVEVSRDQAIARAAEGLRGGGEGTAALVGGGSSNEEGWLVQRILRQGLGAQSVDCGPSPVDPAALRELSRPELSARVRDLDYAGAILVIGTEPLHEMPILDLRIRKAVRRAGARLLVATERPSALDGGAEAAVRYAPGEGGSFVRALAGALSGDAGAGPYAKEAAGVAKALRAVPDPIVVWGERLWRHPGAVPALLEVAGALGVGERIGPGLLEVASEANGRGLREVGCLPGVGPGLASAPAGRDAAGIREALAGEGPGALMLVNSDPVRTHPDTDGWRKALADSFVVSIACFEDHSTAHADLVFPAETHAEKEGTVTHPDGRLQRLRPNVPHPDQVRPGWRVLCDLAAALGLELDLPDQPSVLAAMAAEVGMYGRITDEEIGGTGVRWQERSPGRDWKPAPEALPAPAPTAAATGPAGDGLVLGTYRELWASEATERNPALRFLIPDQRLELAAGDAERLELASGDAVTVSVNGTSIEARVAIRERMRPGAAFLIEGTREHNANLLANGAPQRITILPATPDIPGGEAEEMAE
jgi:NADH-quinone oxidoreductase subunit G